MCCSHGGGGGTQNSTRKGEGSREVFRGRKDGKENKEKRRGGNIERV